MIGALLLSLLAATPDGSAGAYTLADCRFRKIDFKKADVKGPTRPMGLLFRTSGEGGRYIAAADLRVSDPSNMIQGLPLMGGFYTEDGKMLFIVTDDSRPVHFKLVLSARSESGKWRGAVGMNGAGGAAKLMEHSYMGECDIGQPADATARFEALGAAR